MDKLSLKGKNQLLAIFGLFMILELITIISTLITMETQDIITGILRLLISIILFYFIIKKKNWAKVLISILSILSGLGALGLGLVGIFMVGLSAKLLWFLLTAVIFTASGIIMIASKSIKLYMKSN